MQIDSMLWSGARRDLEQEARGLDAAGFAGLWYSEVKHDPFIALTAAAHVTADCRLGTSIAVAFARNPMNLAQLGRDLQDHTGGRFTLGLGSQVKAHIERRYSMPWGKPAARMRELIQAIRAIWAAWQTEQPLRFTGEFYTHTLMTPFFSPGPTDRPDPPIVLAAVGELMTGVAAEEADGLFAHAFSTPRYLREVTLPAVERGLAGVGRPRDGFTVIYPGLVATGRDDGEIARRVAEVRAQIAFYGSTPAYAAVLDLHGWGHLGRELHALSTSDRPDRWQAMGRLVTDEVLAAFAVVGAPEEVAREVRARYGDLVDRFVVYLPGGVDPALVAPIAGPR